MSQPTLGHIKRVLQTLPRGMKGLDETYEQAIKRIEGQEKGYRELAKQVLSWVTYAKRPLSITEVQHALAVSADMTDMDRDFLPEVEVLGSICAGLITIDQNSHVLRLVHYTTREYFERMSSFPDAEKDIAATFVTYLSFDIFNLGYCSTDQEFETRLQLYPLYHYAAQNWGHHVHEASTILTQPITNLLKSEPKVSACSQAMMVSDRDHYKGYSQEAPKQTTAVHLMAYLGLMETTRILLENGHRPDIKDSNGRTPLSWAAENGHEAVARLLLDRADVNVNLKDRFRQTPLSRAAENGHEVVVRLLLDRADVEINSKYGHDETPLSRATVRGDEAVVRLLLDRADVEVNSKNRFDQTLLSRAAVRGHEAVVRLLLDRTDVDVNLKDRFGQTPLSRAAENGHEAVATLIQSHNSQSL